MADKQQQGSTKDFFALLTQEGEAPSSVATQGDQEYIVFRDADGSMKMLHEGKVMPLPESHPAAQESPQSKQESQKINQKSETAKTKPTQPQTPTQTQKQRQGIESLVSDRASEHAHAIETVIKTAKVFFADRSLEQRFRNVVITRLKGVRDSVDFSATLSRPVAQGGLGFDNHTVERVVKALQPYLRQRVDIDHSAGAVRDDVPQLVFKPKAAQSTGSPTDPLASADTKKAKEISDSILQATSKPAASVASKKVEKQAPQQQKPKVTDIRFTPQTVGPIEELQRLTLKDFRRLGDSPERIISRLKEKIELLEDESFTQKIEGIRAWRHSDVYALYVDIGDQSIAEKKSIAEVIDARMAAKEQTLTFDEFEAVSDFNQWLRH